MPEHVPHCGNTAHVNVIFEPDAREIDRRLSEEDALHVLLVDDDRIPTAYQVDSADLEAAVCVDVNASPDERRRSMSEHIDRWAASLPGARPDIAYLPHLTSYAQVRIAIALARRDIRVVVGTSRERFLGLADDDAVAAAIWT